MNIIRLVLLGLASVATMNGYSQVRSGDNVVIKDRITHDLYIAGGTVVIDAPVEGDLIVAGGTVTVNDTIEQDILVAAGNVLLNGYAVDDIRCAGGTITLSNRLAGDFVVAGGRITIDENAAIEGNLLASGGEVTVDGKIDGAVRAVSGEFTLNGIVNGEVEAKGGSIVVNGTIGGPATLAAQTIRVGSKAAFADDVTYWSRDGSPDFESSLKNGKAVFDPGLELESGKWHFLGFASFLAVIWYLVTALLMIVLLQYFFPHTFHSAADTVKNLSLKSLGLGFLFLIGVPIAIVLAMVTIIGLPVAMLMLTGYITVLLLATVISSLLIAHWINRSYYGSSWKSIKIVMMAFVIFIFLKLASLTPVVGPLIMLILACMAFGGILLNVKWRDRIAPSLT